MDHINSLNIRIGNMADTTIIMSCVDYSHETMVVTDFQEQVVEQIIGHYHTCLLDNRAALKHLLFLGIDLHRIRESRMGLCDRSLHRLFPSSRTLYGAQVRGLLQVHGLLKPSGHEVFRGCIVIPLFDENGLIAGLFGKRLTHYIRRNGRRHLLWLATQQAINRVSFPSLVLEI